MKKFKEWLETKENLTEAAKGLKDLQFQGNSPNFKVQITEQGRFIRLYVSTPKGSKFAGDLHSNECFNNTTLYPGFKLFAWHSDINESLAGGFGPFLYDIAMELATMKGGYLVSHAFVNRLMSRHLKDTDGDGNPDELDSEFPNLRGGSGGDPTDEAEAVYRYYYYNRKDVESTMPNIMFANPKTLKSNKVELLPDQYEKPYMYELYRKSPTTVQQMIELNKQGKIVLIDGMNQPILSL